MTRPRLFPVPANARAANGRIAPWRCAWLRLALALLAAGTPGRLRGTEAPAPVTPVPTAKAKTRVLPPKRVYHATRLAGAPPKVDGKLDDACW
jgi:hypothetical protein